MPEPTAAAPSLARNALLPVSLVLSFVLWFWARLPLWQVALAVAPLLALFALAPAWGERSLAAFDRDALSLRAKGEHRGLRARLRRAWPALLFAPPALIAEREGMVYLETGDAARAHDAYRRASEAWGESAPLPVVLGRAHAAYLAERDDDAIRIYRRLEEVSPGLPKVAVRLADALARNGKAKDARAALDAAPKSDSVEVDAVRRTLRATKKKKR